MAESLGTVELGIRVDDEQANRDLLQFGRNAQKVGNDAANGFKQLDQQLGLSATAVSSLSAALGTLAVGEFLRQSVQSAIELETITRKLSNTLGEQGAAGALNFTRGLADELGLSFKTLAQTFSSFTAAATAANVPIETQRNLFAAVSKAAQQLGLSNDELSGSLLALQQVASKGTVQMEELRGQLGERLPIAFAAAAKGLGLTQQELIKLVESGKLTADQFFPALTKGLNELTAGAAGAETTAQKLQKLSNAIEDLKVSIGEGLAPALTTAADALSKFIKQGGKIDDAAQIGLTRRSRGLDWLLGLPSQANTAVDALTKLEQQFNLTDKQARALFTDAAKQSGGVVTAFGELRLSAEQFEAVLKKLPALAKEFRDKYPDRQAQLQAENAAAAALLQQQAKSINSIDNLNAKLKAQRDELSKVEIGSQQFQQLTQDIRGTEGQLNAATEAAKGTGAALANLRQQYSTSGLDLQSLQLNVGKERLALAQQLGQAEQDLANARFNTEDALLEAEKKRALEGVRSEAQRQQIEEEFQRRKEALEVKRLDYREQAAKREMALQERSMQLEARMTELAGQRSLLNAQRELAEARRTNDPEKIRIAEEGLRLVQEELSISRTISQEKIQGQKEINALRLKQISEERAAALADNLPPLPKPLQPAGNGIVEFKFDATPIDKNSNAVSDAAGQIGQSNTNLIQQISDNTAAVNNLVAKDWSVYAVLPDNPNPVPLLTP